MLPHRRGTDFPASWRGCNAFYTYEMPMITQNLPFMRSQPDYYQYDAGYLQPTPGFIDHRQRSAKFEKITKLWSEF